MKRKDGSYFYVEESGEFLRNKKGNICRVVGVKRDITERKITEEQLRQAEEIRQKEIHHRIKNNLQVISSLLDLQSDKFEDSKVLEAFRESRNRVNSMSIIHEELYRSSDIEKLDFADYLEKLARQLHRTYSTERDKIHLNLNIEKHYLKVDNAIPLGIIINEMVSNSLKHAFPEGKSKETKKEIRIKFSKEKGSGHRKTSRYILIVSNNGDRFPENIDFKNAETLGLQLINTLVDQIDGSVELKKKNGTEFRIEFEDIE